MHNLENHNLDLFADTSRWPRKPYCSDDKTARLIRSLSSALKRPYIQANPPHLRVWSIFDVDREGAALAWDDAGLPPPAWAATNTENGHAHLVWGLSAPVLVDSPDMRQAPLRYLCAVEAAFRAKLQADSGYSGLITKNPAFPDWRILRGPRVSFDLGELAEYVDLPKFAPKRKPEEVGLGRNVTLFDHVRLKAYRDIRGYKRAASEAYVWWQKAVYDNAMDRNGDFIHPLHHREVYHVARSVSKWTWRRFEVKDWQDDPKWRAKQAHRGKLGGLAKGAASEDKRASALIMWAKGIKQTEIALALGVADRTIRRWLDDPA